MVRTNMLIVCAFAFSVFACQPAQTPLTDTERDAIGKQLIAKHAEMLEAASRADADALFSHFSENNRGILAFDGTLTLTREKALDGLKSAYSGLKEQEFEMIEEYVTVISPGAAVLTGLGKVTSYPKSGDPTSATFSVSIVFVLRDGEWKVIHVHESVPNVTG